MPRLIAIVKCKSVGEERINEGNLVAKVSNAAGNVQINDTASGDHVNVESADRDNLAAFLLTAGRDTEGIKAQEW